jgi:membrane-bound lytic murein transglycosylase A
MHAPARGLLCGTALLATLCAPVRLRAQDGAVGQPFATRNASFEPVAFDQVPGWNQDALHESADGMRTSCAALRRKAAWSEVCADFDRVDTGSDAALRGFFQRNFHAYRILSPARQPDGLITGYFEPLLEGRRQRDDRYRFPVYGQPRDLLLMDAALRGAGTSQWMKVQGGRLVSANAGQAGARQLTLALDDANASIRDKRLRVRLDGDTVRPYWSRQDIELRALDAPVLAWVSEPQRLYSMQVQGSGKIRLEDGTLVRVSVSEQNGHPFLPNITRGGDAGLVLQAIKTRGLKMGVGSAASMDDPALPAPVNDEVARMIAMLQGQPGANAPSRPAAPQASSNATRPTSRPTARPASTGRNSEVDAMIAALSGNGPAPAPPPAAGAPAASTPPPKSTTARPGAPIAAVDSAGAPAMTNIPDPSYVFFRSTGGDGPEGPIGALGVPLTAGRSLAVDPRSTPLGSPVFISTSNPSGSGPMRRLMFAQDTGGAIRGSVRGDLFWGFGDSAGKLALATNDTAQMWLLLPRTQVISAEQATPATRGLHGRQALHDCVIDDPDLCVEP